MASATIKSIAAEAAPTDTPPFLPMRTYRRPTIPADAHGNRGRGFSRDSHQSLAKAASMASLRVRRTLTRAKRLSLASISVQGAISVLVRSTMSPTASA